MTSSEGGLGTWMPKESAIWIAPMVPPPAAGRRPTRERAATRPGPSVVLRRLGRLVAHAQARRAPSAPERPRQNVTRSGLRGTAVDGPRGCRHPEAPDGDDVSNVHDSRRGGPGRHRKATSTAVGREPARRAAGAVDTETAAPRGRPLPAAHHRQLGRRHAGVALQERARPGRPCSRSPACGISRSRSFGC